MLVPENHVCTTMAEIQALTQADHRLWVFKPATSQPAVYAFAPSTKDEQTDFVQYLGQKELSPLMLQERVKGVDLAIGCYYYGGEPILSTVHSALEFRRFMNGNIGPAVGSSGCVAWYWKVLPAKLWNATHAKMMPFLKRFGYTGPLTIRTCISDKDQMPWFLEAVCRVNGCVTEALAEVSPIPLSDFFLDAARDRLRDFKPSYDWAGCVRVSTPPYPASVDASLSEGKPLSDLDPSDPHIWPMDIEKTGNGYCTAGVDGAVCDVTAKSQTIADVGKQILDRCERIVLLDKQYRTDLGDCAHHRMDKLREWKYIR
jgi:phosphoribosylamine-glycine ligase